MKVGDLVELAPHVTRRGHPHDDQQGLVIEIKGCTTKKGGWEIVDHSNAEVIVSFCGVFHTYPRKYLRIVNSDK